MMQEDVLQKMKELVALHKAKLADYFTAQVLRLGVGLGSGLGVARRLLRRAGRLTLTVTLTLTPTVTLTLTLTLTLTAVLLTHLLTHHGRATYHGPTPSRRRTRRAAAR